MLQTPNSFRGARTCWRSFIAMPSLVGLGFHSPPWWPKTLSFLSVCLFVCLFVCLIVTLLNVRDCAPDFAMKALEYRNDFEGRFVVLHPCSVLSDCCQLATTLNAEVQKTAKLFFSPTEGDRINRSRRNLTCKRIPWVCYSTPHFAVIGKRGRYRSPQNVKICPKLWFLVTGNRHSEQIQMKFGTSV